MDKNQSINDPVREAFEAQWRRAYGYQQGADKDNAWEWWQAALASPSASALARDEASAERPDPTDIQGWSVTVNVNAQDILTIGHNNLSGIDNIGEFADVVRNCAEHLVSFIGATPPSPDAREAGGGVTLTDEQRKWVMDAALILANSVSAAERQVSSKLLALLREAGSGK